MSTSVYQCKWSNTERCGNCSRRLSISSSSPGIACVAARVGIINLLNANKNIELSKGRRDKRLSDWETSLQMSNVMALIDVCSIPIRMPVSAHSSDLINPHKGVQNKRTPEANGDTRAHTNYHPPPSEQSRLPLTRTLPHSSRLRLGHKVKRHRWQASHCSMREPSLTSSQC